MSFLSRVSRAVAIVLSACSLGAYAAAPRSAPPITPNVSEAPLASFLSPDRPEATLRLELGAVDPARIAAAKKANAGAILKRLQVGLGRDTAGRDAASARNLTWQPVAGGYAARWQVRSPDAKSLRIGLVAGALPAGLQLRFAGNAKDAVYGPVDVAEILSGGAVYWGPVVEGDTETMEVFVPAGTDTAAVALWISGVSHLFVAASDPKIDVALKGASLSCEVNFICRAGSDAALAQAGTAVARIFFTDSSDGKSYTCTGTALSNTAAAAIPYFATADHCVGDQATASTVTSFWFLETTSCTGTAINPNETQVTGGATLLSASSTTDFTLLRLNKSTPSGVAYAGWNAANLAAGIPVTGIHHPNGDVKKVSLGTSRGIAPAKDLGPGTYIVVNWNSNATGFTEGGSSGSGLFTRSSSSGNYEFRGALFGGNDEMCTTPQSELIDYYSRFDLAYTAVAQYLAPNACTYAIGSSSASIAANGGAGSFSLTTGGTCSWAAVSSVAWVTTTSSGSGNGTITFTVDANPGAARSGVITVGGQNFTVTQAAGTTAATDNYTGLWFTSSEPGWGLNLSHEGDLVFATLYTYFTDGQPMWLYASPLQRQADGSFTGPIYRATGPAFYAQPWGNYTSTQVGTMTLRFSSTTAGTVQYTYNGTVVSKSITPFAFATPATTCSSTTTAGQATASNYQDLWWNPAEPGWGLNLAHQGSVIFATLYTYDANGRDYWLFADDAVRQGDGSFRGTFYQATGPAFNASPWGPFAPVAVGNFTLAFSAGDAGTLTYTVGLRTVTKSISRYVFTTTPTACH